jgi:hypothetical protein
MVTEEEQISGTSLNNVQKNSLFGPPSALTIRRL